MNKRIVVAGAFVAAALAFVLGRATAGDEMTAQEQAWMELGKPGPEHVEMAKCAGTWETTMKAFRDPAAPPLESKGTATFRTIMDGRYLVQDFTGMMPGFGPFTGMGIEGYDNASKKYWSVWLDSWSTGAMMSWGSKGADATKLEMSGECNGPGGQKITMRHVVTQVDADTMHFEMFSPGPDGKECRCMEIVYKRKK